ncbi:MAG TPA: response regulator [Chryseosolibacter sp.]|nr:response regulator [Chryseosolibacter sp.]
MAANGPILIVDDDFEDLELAREIIQEIGLSNKVYTFHECEQALTYLMNNLNEQPFIILSDVNLPRMNGIEFKKKIDETPALRQKSIPFVYYTTSGDKTIVTKVYELTVQGFFVKPTKIEEMRESFRLIFEYWKKSRHPNS